VLRMNRFVPSERIVIRRDKRRRAGPGHQAQRGPVSRAE